MITITSFQVLADDHPYPACRMGEDETVPLIRRNERTARKLPADYQAALRANALKAAVALLTSENRSLQESLDEERKFSAELRLALEKQRQAAITDPLTGLFNRRAMDQHLHELLDESDNTPLSVLMLDIDHLKHINDTYGHSHGDSVIRQVAEVLGQCLRGEDSAFRYGGEEFMVVLPNTPMEGAITVAESIRRRVEQLHLDSQTSSPMGCTVSLGVASRKASEDGVSLFKRADQALYQAKHRGRNQVAREAG